MTAGWALMFMVGAADLWERSLPEPKTVKGTILTAFAGLVLAAAYLTLGLAIVREMLS